jgi:hypothetical protein
MRNEDGRMLSDSRSALQSNKSRKGFVPPFLIIEVDIANNEHFCKYRR